jgi:hypothetical protein
LDFRSLLIGAACGCVVGCTSTGLVMNERHQNFVKAARGIRSSEAAARQMGMPEARVEEISREFWEKAE